MARKKWEIYDVFGKTNWESYRLKDTIKEFESQGLETKTEEGSFGIALYIKI